MFENIKHYARGHGNNDYFNDYQGDYKRLRQRRFPRKVPGKGEHQRHGFGQYFKAQKRAQQVPGRDNAVEARDKKKREEHDVKP